MMFVSINSNTMCVTLVICFFVDHCSSFRGTTMSCTSKPDHHDTCDIHCVLQQLYEEQTGLRLGESLFFKFCRKDLFFSRYVIYFTYNNVKHI
jgi:hypothetical protein